MMTLLNMAAMCAAVPDGMYDASLGPVLLGLVLALFAIGGGVLLSGRRDDRAQTASRRARRLTAVRRAAFGAAH